MCCLYSINPSNFMKNITPPLMLLKFIIKIYLFDSDNIVSDYLENCLDQLSDFHEECTLLLTRPPGILKNNEKLTCLARVSLNKVIKNGSCISNRTSAALVKRLDGGWFSSDEFSNSSFLLAAQLLKPSFNFLQCCSARTSFSLLFAKRPLELRTLKRYGGLSCLLGVQIWEFPFGDFCSFSVACTTPRTAKYVNGLRQFLSAVSLDRWL